MPLMAASLRSRCHAFSPDRAGFQARVVSLLEESAGVASYSYAETESLLGWLNDPFRAESG